MVRNFASTVAVFVCSLPPTMAQEADVRIPPDEVPRQFDEPQGTPALVQTTEFIRAAEARDKFNVNGTGITVAVLDTGLNTKHVDFAGNGRIPAQRNFTTDNNGDDGDATDGEGHGTNCGGIIVAHGDHTGIAPGANIIPLKVLSNAGSGSFTSIRDALQWVIENRQTHNISVVNVSISDQQNHANDQFAGIRKEIADRIATLRQNRVAVVISAGNEFFGSNSQQGMGFPAIVRQSVSAGAVYDANVGPFTYQSGAEAHSTAAGRVTPFSQRLHPNAGGERRTDIFAPGAPLTSAGINGIHGESIQHGTSQAAPVAAGVICLMQQYYLRTAGELPSVDQLEEWLRTGVEILDGDDEDDNVMHPDPPLAYVRVDAMQALGAVDGHLRGALIRGAVPVKNP